MYLSQFVIWRTNRSPNGGYLNGIYYILGERSSCLLALTWLYGHCFSYVLIRVQIAQYTDWPGLYELLIGNELKNRSSKTPQFYAECYQQDKRKATTQRRKGIFKVEMELLLSTYNMWGLFHTLLFKSGNHPENYVSALFCWRKPRLRKFKYLDQNH